jgi:hypothetical protein
MKPEPLINNTVITTRKSLPFKWLAVLLTLSAIFVFTSCSVRDSNNGNGDSVTTEIIDGGGNEKTPQGFADGNSSEGREGENGTVPDDSGKINGQTSKSSVFTRGEVISIQDQILQFRLISENLPLDDIESATDLLRAFKSLANEDIPNDDLFCEYEYTMQDIVESLNSSLGDDASINDELIMNALENGFLFVDEQDSPHFILRDDFFYDTFYTYLSEPYRELLALRKKHYLFSEGHDHIENSTLMISWDQLAEMITDWENYLKMYTDMEQAADIEYEVDFYLKLYIGSVQIDNSGLYDYIGDSPDGEPILRLNEAPKESYIRFTENYKDSIYYPIISGLLAVYQSNDYVYSEDIDEFFAEKELDIATNGDY